MESIWMEIRNTYYDESEKCICIDGWTTDDDNEEGTVIAKIHTDNGFIVEYLDLRAETDPYVQEIIRQTIEELETDEEEQEPEPDVLHITVNFRLLMREGETVDEALQRFTEVVLDDVVSLAEHHMDWELVEYEGE